MEPTTGACCIRLHETVGSRRLRLIVKPLGRLCPAALDVKCRRGQAMTMQLTAVFEKVPEGYIAFVEELPGANTQGATLEEARTNLQEAVELVLEANRVLAEEALNGRAVIREPFVIISK